MLRPILVLVMIVQVGIPLRAQGNDVDRELEEAKALYREAKFAQAIAKLQATIGRLEQLRDIQARKIQLSDAHLHLALSYVALNDPSAAKESLKAMLRADPAKRLDPQVYAPKVVELFEQARIEVGQEPAPQPTAAAVGPTGPPAAGKKKGTKTLPVLLGVGAAAAGGAALALGGGGNATEPSAATGQDDIILVAANPPPGSTLSLSSNPTIVLSFRYTLVSRARTCLSTGHGTSRSGRFCTGANVPIGRATNSTLDVRLDVAPAFRNAGCSAPIDLSVLQAAFFGEGDCETGAPFVDKFFDAAYRIVP